LRGGGGQYEDRKRKEKLPGIFPGGGPCTILIKAVMPLRGPADVIKKVAAKSCTFSRNILSGAGVAGGTWGPVMGRKSKRKEVPACLEVARLGRVGKKKKGHGSLAYTFSVRLTRNRKKKDASPQEKGNCTNCELTGSDSGLARRSERGRSNLLMGGKKWKPSSAPEGASCLKGGNRSKDAWEPKKRSTPSSK